jgi:hypothetical protein
MLEYAHKKISPDESEDLPGLSAGSSDSEELPDPTKRKVSSGLGRRQETRDPISATSELFAKDR